MLCVSGAIFAASNAAIMLVQLGDEGGAVLEMQRIARRAPGSADMRAALAALYWSQASHCLGFRLYCFRVYWSRATQGFGDQL